MAIDRRKFMKFAGLTAALSLAGKPTFGALADEDSLEATPPLEKLDKLAADAKAVQEPLTAKRWAMVVDLKKCHQAKDCKNCIQACHHTHNVPEFESPKDEIKWMWKEEFEHAFHEQEFEFLKEEYQHAPTLLLCNHCDKPPCVKVCPTGATWRRDDGIVMMDWHRCIGCRYCIAGCPYGSRSFNWRDPRPFIKDTQIDFPTRMRGVVEKCTFCEELLARGQLPSCVEACTEKALVFGDLEDPNSEVRQILSSQFSIRRKPALGTHPEVYYLI